MLQDFDTPGDASPVICARALTKTYTFHQQSPGLLGSLRSLVRRTTESRLAVDAVDMTVHPGEMLGFLGPNGAGKTTTLKMLSGLLYPTSGELSVLGHTPSKRDTEYLRRISLVMGQKTMLWWDVPAEDSFLLHKDMYGLSDADYRRSVDELAEMLDVGPLLHVQVRKLSLGERMKMELMAALLHRPDVLFLDEPTIGLDVVAKARVRDFLAEVNRFQGTTILITSHDMDDIEALCDRVMIINHGVIGYDGRLDELVRQTNPRKRIQATFTDPVDPARLPGEWTTWIGERDEDPDPRIVLLEVPRDRMSEVLQVLPRLGNLGDLSVTDVSVEEIIRDLFTREGTVTV